MNLFIVVIVLLESAGTVLWLFRAHFVGNVADAATSGNLELCLEAILYLLIVAVVLIVLEPFIMYTSGQYGERMINTLRKRTVECAAGATVGYLDSQKSGDLISRINNDLQKMQGLIQRGVWSLLYSPISFLAAFIYAMTINWVLTLVSVVTAPLLTWVASKLARQVEVLERRELESKAELNALAQDTISGFQVIKVFNLHRTWPRRMRLIIDEMQWRQVLLLRIYSLNAPLQNFIHILPMVLVFLVGGILVIRGQIRFGELIVFYELQRFLTSPVQIINTTFFLMREFIPAADRLFAVWDSPRDVAGTATGPVDPGTALECQKVGFHYRSDMPVLTNLNFSITRNEIVALVGPSGCGKTTVTNLLTRFYNTVSGEVRLFGRNIEAWDLESARKQLSLVTQDTYLYPDSIFTNIEYGNPGATREQVEAAAEQAGCLEFIRDFPQGYKTLVGERGVKLSGGQRQRVAIARALLKNAPILLLDEPTSALDTASEQYIQQGLELLMQGRTSLIIAHRLSTIKHATRILVLDKGGIVQEGSHVELMQSDGLYRRLYEKQYQEIEE
ncbi:MAG: ABC transporter ATP-binding protein [Spirochaetales bacterium]|nr:ABC transporter ATP-binding protein [Spirochaetales bacterium]